MARTSTFIAAFLGLAATVLPAVAQDYPSSGDQNIRIEVMDLLPTEPSTDEPTSQDTTTESDDTPTPPALNVDPNTPIVDPNAPIDSESLPPPISYNAVILNGVNKVTARSEEVSGALGTVLRFSNLEIIAHKCQSIVDNGEHGFAALLEIWEFKAGDSPKKILQGWMFSTSPSLFSLEHPLYDVTIKSCTNLDSEADTKTLEKQDSNKSTAPKEN